MKFYKITIMTDGTKMIYPSGYVGGIDRQHKAFLYYDEGGVTYQIIALPDTVAFVDNNVTEITLEEACAKADIHKPKKTIITDEGMIRTIEIKSRLGIELTIQEQKAIDLEDETPGISWSQSLSEKFIELANV